MTTVSHRVLLSLARRVLNNQARGLGLYGRVLTEVESTDQMQ